MKKGVLNWLAVLVWMAVIYYFSNQPDLHSSLPGMWDLIFRKIAHLAEFFVLAYLVFTANRASSWNYNKSLLIALIISIGYSLFDEWHQGFVADRVSSLTDSMIDSLGVVIYITLNIWQSQKK